MPRPLSRRFAPAALFALSLVACLAACGHVLAPSSAAQSSTPATFGFGASPYRVSEGDGGVTVTVVRSGGAGREVSVEYQASSGYLMAKGCGYLTWVGTATPGADYEPARGTLTFAAGETAKTFRVPVIDDTQIESREPETVFLSLDFSHEAPAGSIDCFGRTSIIYIHDNDPPPPPPPPPSGRRQIAFGSNRDGNYEIYSMDEDGASQRRLTNTLASEGRPTWSPDGKRIAFTSDGDGPGKSALFVMNADGTNVTRLSGPTAAPTEPAWSPDGTRIAFTAYTNTHSSEIFVVNADGTNQVNLTNNRGEDFHPAWSPDGRRLAFTSRRDNDTFSVYVMDSDGANVRRLVEGYSRDPAWSPDGTRVAYAAQATQNGATSIFVVNTDGTNKRLLTGEHPFVFDVTPAWSPDGAKIAYASNRDGYPSNYEIYVMNADGTNITRITNHPAHEALPAWQPGAAATPAGPVLLAEAGTSRAVALDSVTFVLDPFTVVSPANMIAADRRTRVALFAAGVAQPVTASDITVQAEDPAGRALQLPVEYVGRVSGFDWLTQIVVRLPDDVATADHLWLGLNVRGTLSNKAVVTMKAKQ
jgi:Tol biopolymer transport system component